MHHHKNLEEPARARMSCHTEFRAQRQELESLARRIPTAQSPEDRNNPGTQESQTGTVQLDRCTVPASPASPTISLWELLNQSRPGRETQSKRSSETFLPRVRDTLCLNLALSLLQLSNDEWISIRWCSDENTSIFFLNDPGTQAILDKTRPYLSWRLQQESKAEYGDHDLRCDPQLLDFAQLLVEIHRWERLPQFEVPPTIQSRRAPSKEEFRSTLCKFVNQHFRVCDTKFTLAVNACLDIAGREARDQSNPAKIQEYIFQKIVLPLEAYAVNPEPESTLTNLRCSDQRHLDKPKTTLSPMSLYDESVNYDEPEDKCSQADGFFRDMRKFTERYVSGISKDTRRPKLIDRKIRIAVIDSGVRKVDPTICGARSGKHKKIQDCRNFSSSDPKDWDDEVGHGTMVTHLLLDVAPEAELFIAKVSSQKKIPRNKLYHIAEAINWAVQEWKVDIITISIALSEENHLIDEALEQALDPSFDDATGKIIFAAAGNKGGNGQQAWPARKKGVIAIHATDWYGTAANFNSTSDEGNVNFATLGRDIRVEWLSDVDSGEWKNRYISGTSFATPIAAGIAANVLEFARHKLKRTTRRRDRLFSHDGMRKIFRAMSSRIGDYHYVQPWTLWEKAERGDWGDHRSGIVLSPDEPENICKVLEFIIGIS